MNCYDADSDSDSISFVVEDTTFVASRKCLMLVSDYFKAMLLGNFQDARKKSVTLTGLDATAFGQALQWASDAATFG
jgi:BTB/POZ domain